MTDPFSAKRLTIAAISSLPENASMEHVIERLYLTKQIRKGLDDIDAGRVVPHEEVEREFATRRGD